MAEVCVITGGGSGMGLAAAKFMPAEKIIVISGRTVSKLEGAAEEDRLAAEKDAMKNCGRKAIRSTASPATPRTGKASGSSRNLPKASARSAM